MAVTINVEAFERRLRTLYESWKVGNKNVSFLAVMLKMAATLAATRTSSWCT